MLNGFNVASQTESMYTLNCDLVAPVAQCDFAE